MDTLYAILFLNELVSKQFNGLKFCYRTEFVFLTQLNVFLLVFKTNNYIQH